MLVPNFLILFLVYSLLIKIIVYFAIGYLAYYLFKDTKFLSNFGINRKKEKEEYKNLDITDADYEDIEKENES